MASGGLSALAFGRDVHQRHSASEDPSPWRMSHAAHAQPGPIGSYSVNSVDSRKSSIIGEIAWYPIRTGTHMHPPATIPRKHAVTISKQTRGPSAETNHSHGTPPVPKKRGLEKGSAGYPRRTRTRETLRRVNVVEPIPRPSLSPLDLPKPLAPRFPIVPRTRGSGVIRSRVTGRISARHDVSVSGVVFDVHLFRARRCVDAVVVSGTV